MKIAYIYFSHPGGGEVYFSLLKGVVPSSINIKLPRFLEFLPLLANYYIKKKVDLSQIDIIHTDDHMAHIFKRNKIKLVLTVYHNIFDENYQKYTSTFQKIYHYFWIRPNLVLSLKKADKIIAISKFTQKSLRRNFKIPHNKINVVYNGINTNIFSPQKNIYKKNRSTWRILFVGNINKRKGFDLLPKIMDRLGDKYQLYFTSGLKNVREIEKKFGVTNNMHSLGKLSLKKLVEEYNKCDIFLFPTRLEGFGYVVAEAMACGKPVVSTSYSAIPEIVNSENGFLCPLDDIECFVKAIKRITNKKQNIFDYVKNREKIIKKFSIEEFKKNMDSFYKNLFYS